MMRLRDALGGLCHILDIVPIADDKNFALLVCIYLVWNSFLKRGNFYPRSYSRLSIPDSYETGGLGDRSTPSFFGSCQNCASNCLIKTLNLFVNGEEDVNTWCEKCWRPSAYLGHHKAKEIIC